MRRRVEEAARSFFSVAPIWDPGFYIFDGTSAYGPYPDRETAGSRIGRTDSLGFTIRGLIVEYPKVIE